MNMTFKAEGSMLLAQRLGQCAKETRPEHRLFVLVDLCDLNAPLLTTVQQWEPSVPFWLLFEKTPEESIREEGPLLLQLDVHEPSQLTLLEKMCDCAFGDHRLLAFTSAENGEVLVPHLRQALQVRWGEEEGLLRYYTPDVFEAVNQVLTPLQRQWFHQYAQRWFWMSDGGEWHEYDGLAGDTEKLTLEEGLVFTQQQHDDLLLWADVSVFMQRNGGHLKMDEYGGETMLLQQLHSLMRQAERAGIYSAPERFDFVLGSLQKLRA